MLPEAPSRCCAPTCRGKFCEQHRNHRQHNHNVRRVVQYEHMIHHRFATRPVVRGAEWFTPDFRLRRSREPDLGERSMFAVKVACASWPSETPLVEGRRPTLKTLKGYENTFQQMTSAIPLSRDLYWILGNVCEQRSSHHEWAEETCPQISHTTTIVQNFLPKATRMPHDMHHAALLLHVSLTLAHVETFTSANAILAHNSVWEVRLVTGLLVELGKKQE